MEQQQNPQKPKQSQQRQPRTPQASPPPQQPKAADVKRAEIVQDDAKTVTEDRRDSQEGGQGPDRRQSVVDRRAGIERRKQTREESGYTGPERRVATAERRETTGLERRRGPGRRRSDDRKAAEEGEMTSEQFEFCMAIEMYKKVNKRMYPTWTEVLEVVRQLGYRKVEHRDINLPNVPEPELAKVA